jgi:hypothetical protein
MPTRHEAWHPAAGTGTPPPARPASTAIADTCDFDSPVTPRAAASFSHPPGRHSQQARRRDDRGQRSLRPAPVLQKPREVRPGSQLRDRQLDRPGPSVPLRDARHGGFSTWPPHRLHTASTPARYYRDTAWACKTRLPRPHSRRVIAIKIMVSSHSASVSSPSIPDVHITWPMSAGLTPSQAPRVPGNHARQFREGPGRGPLAPAAMGGSHDVA